MFENAALVSGGIFLLRSNHLQTRMPSCFISRKGNIVGSKADGQDPCKLPVQHIGRHRHSMLVAGGIDEFAHPDRARLVGPHQAV